MAEDLDVVQDDATTDVMVEGVHHAATMEATIATAQPLLLKQ